MYRNINRRSKLAFKKWLRKNTLVNEEQKDKEKERKHKERQSQIDDMQQRKKVMGDIAFKEWLEKKRMQRRLIKNKKINEERRKEKHRRPKTSHGEVFLAYSYMGASKSRKS